MSDGPDTAGQSAPQEAEITAFALLGGETGVRRLVDRFYDLMDLEPAYAHLRGLHPTTLEGSRDKLFWFLCGWLGGPDHFVERFGHPRLRARHMPFSIGVRERDDWMACMRQAMQDCGLDGLLRERLDAALMNTADWMRNRGV